MRTMSAKDAKNRFGELLLEAQKAPVTIEKNGKPVAVLLLLRGASPGIERAKLEWLRAAIAEADADGRSAVEVYEMTDELDGGRSSAEGESLLDDAVIGCLTPAVHAREPQRELRAIWRWIAADSGAATGGRRA